MAPIDSKKNYSDLDEVENFIEREKKLETLDKVLEKTGKNA